MTLKEFETHKSNEAICDAIVSCIREDIKTKIAIVKAAAIRAGVSQRATMDVLDRWTGNEPMSHQWVCTVGARGAKVYSLLPSVTA